MIWELLSPTLTNLELGEQQPTLQHILGAAGDVEKLQLTIMAEVLNRVNGKAGANFDARTIVKQSLATVINCEPLSEAEKECLRDLKDDIES